MTLGFAMRSKHWSAEWPKAPAEVVSLAAMAVAVVVVAVAQKMVAAGCG